MSFISAPLQHSSLSGLLTPHLHISLSPDFCHQFLVFVESQVSVMGNFPRLSVVDGVRGPDFLTSTIYIYSEMCTSPYLTNPPTYIYTPNHTRSH